MATLSESINKKDVGNSGGVQAGPAAQGGLWAHQLGKGPWQETHEWFVNFPIFVAICILGRLGIDMLWALTLIDLPTADLISKVNVKTIGTDAPYCKGYVWLHAPES